MNSIVKQVRFRQGEERGTKTNLKREALALGAYRSQPPSASPSTRGAGSTRSFPIAES
jgi:hypothetical protein